MDILRRRFMMNSSSTIIGDDFDLGPADYVIEYTADGPVRFGGGNWDHNPDITYGWYLVNLSSVDCPFKLVKDIWYPNEGRGIWGFQGTKPVQFGGWLGMIPTTNPEERQFDYVTFGWIDSRGVYKVVGNSGSTSDYEVEEEYISEYPIRTLDISSTDFDGFAPGLLLVLPTTTITQPHELTQIYFNRSTPFRMNLEAFPEVENAVLYYDQDFYWSSNFELYTSYSCLSTIYFNNFNKIIVDSNHPYLDSREDCGGICTKSVLDKNYFTHDGSTSKFIPKDAIIASSRDTFIPSTVTVIYDRAFYHNIRLTEIVIPEQITDIGMAAFYKCINLKKVQFNAINCTDLPYNIDDGAVFEGCSSLTEIEFSDEVQYIPSNLFNSTAVTSINLSKNIKGIGYIDPGYSVLRDIYFDGTWTEWYKIKGVDSIHNGITVHCKEVLVSSIEASNIEVEFGDNIQINYTVLPVDADNKIIEIVCNDNRVVINEDNSISVSEVGEYELILSSTDGSNISKSIIVNVKSKSDPNEPIIYNRVDLGIKTSDGKTIYFADKNVGARDIEDSGLYFQWGSAKARSVDESGNVIGDPFDNQHYEYQVDGDFTKYNDSYSVIDPEDDGATVHMGSEWRTPTYSEFKLLLNQVKSSASDSSKPIKLVVVYHDKSTPDIKLEKPYYSSNSFVNTDIINSSTHEVDGLKFINVNTNTELFLPSNGKGNGSTIVTSDTGSIFYAGYWLGDNLLDEESYNMGIGTYYCGRNLLYCCIYDQQNYFGSDFPIIMDRYPGLGIRGICIE